jgi:hypothetical protein
VIKELIRLHECALALFVYEWAINAKIAGETGLGDVDSDWHLPILSFVFIVVIVSAGESFTPRFIPILLEHGNFLNCPVAFIFGGYALAFIFKIAHSHFIVYAADSELFRDLILSYRFVGKPLHVLPHFIYLFIAQFLIRAFANLEMAVIVTKHDFY